MKEKQAEFNNPIHEALMKKALGYSHTEVVEEFISGEEGEIKLNKKRVTTKTDPPDISAIKILIEEGSQGVENLSDEQLEEEKQRLLMLLKQTNSKAKRRKNEQKTK